jgi:Spy/CpxP family protein refolding chaperone
MPRILRFACSALAVLLLAGLAAAQPPGPPERAMSDRFLERHAAELGLDEPTLEHARELLDASRERGEPLEEELRAAHDRMRDLLHADPPDEAAVMEQADAIAAVELTLRKERLSTMMALHALLTPEQRESLRALHEGGPHHHGPWKRFHDLHEACAADRERLCADVGSGRPSLGCLRDHADDLSDACAAALERGHRCHEGDRPPSGGPGMPPPDDEPL